MSINKYRFGELNDDLAQVFDDMMGWPFKASYSYRGKFVNEEDYDVIPKKHTVERKIKEKEQRLQELRDRRANDQRMYDEMERQINDEIYELRKKLSP